MEDSQKPMLQDGISKMLQHMITSNANSPVISSRFHSHSAPAMSISAYVERIVKYTRCSCEALVAAVMFLQYHVTFSGHCVTVFNVHRTLITSVVLAAKSRDDEYYTNTYYAKIGGIPASELKTLELDYINLLEWDCWLDRDAFDETVAMLTELATSDPTAADIAQAVGFWEEKQSRFARNRRVTVRGAIAADVETERRRAQGGGCGAAPITTTTGSASLLAGVFGASPSPNGGVGGGMGFPLGSNNTVSSFGGGALNQSTSSANNQQQHLERLAFGGNGTPVNNNTANNNNGTAANSNAYRDPMNHSMASNASASNSNLVITAPCFYPKGMRPATTASTGRAGSSVTSGLGSNPYQQQQQPSSYDGLAGGRSLNPYGSASNPYATGGPSSYSPTYGGGGGNNSNPFARSNPFSTANGNGFGVMNRAQGYNNNGNASNRGTPSSGLAGHHSMFPSAPSANNNCGSSQPRTPTSGNGPSSWAAVAAASTSATNTGNNNNNNAAAVKRGGSNGTQYSSTTNHGTSTSNNLLLAPAAGGGAHYASGSAINSHNNSVSVAPPGPTTPNTSSPAVVPQGAPGFKNSVGTLNANALATPHGSPNGQQNASTSSNGRLLTKHRFASGDSLSGDKQKTPESNRYSIMGINANQHPNNYYSYSTESAQHSQQQQQSGNAAARRKAGTPSHSQSRNNNNRGGSGSNGLSKHANAQHHGSSDSVNNVGGATAAAAGGSPGIKLSAGEGSVAPAAHQPGGDGADEDDDSVAVERAGSKRGGLRQAGKKREVPSHWQDDR